MVGLLCVCSRAQRVGAGDYDSEDDGPGSTLGGGSSTTGGGGSHGQRQLVARLTAEVAILKEQANATKQLALVANKVCGTSGDLEHIKQFVG